MTLHYILLRRLLLAALAAVVAASGSTTYATAGPALLLEAESGLVLYADEPDRIWHPASLTKLMTAYLTFEAVTKGQLKLDSEVELSAKARMQPATRIGLRRGIKLNVDQAVRGLIMRSANDFAMALAEAVAGSEDAFADRMNATAKRLGMSRSRFKNPHGLPDIEQVTTARDMAQLARALLKDFPQYADVFSSPSVRIHKGTFYSANDLLKTLAGGDGMKTGFTCGAGYNIVASATREGRRIIAIVFGEQNRVKRSQRAAELIEHGFSIFDWKALAKPVKLAALAVAPSEKAEPIYTAGTMRIRRCARQRPVIEPDPEPDNDDQTNVAGASPAVRGQVAAKLPAAVPAAVKGTGMSAGKK